MRIRSSSSDRKNLEWPGSPWRPERPRSWLSMRRLSCRSVPSTNMPPAEIAFSLSRAHLLADVGDAGLAVGPLRHVHELVLDPHLRIAAELDCRCRGPAMLVAMVDRARHAGLGDDVGLLLVVAGVEDGEHLGPGGAVVAAVRAPRRRLGSVKSCCSQPCWPSSIYGQLLGFSRIEVVADQHRLAAPLQSSIRATTERYFSARCGRPRRRRRRASPAGWSGSPAPRDCRCR